jgi:hypothetical protein
LSATLLAQTRVTAFLRLFLLDLHREIDVLNKSCRHGEGHAALGRYPCRDYRLAHLLGNHLLRYIYTHFLFFCLYLLKTTMSIDKELMVPAEFSELISLPLDLSLHAAPALLLWIEFLAFTPSFTRPKKPYLTACEI